MKISIKKGKEVISFESDDAGVPDTTVNAGPNVMEEMEDAQLPESNPNAEFDAAADATTSEVETDDEVELADVRANEAINALWDSIFSEESAAAGEPDPNAMPTANVNGGTAGAEDDEAVPEPEPPAPEGEGDGDGDVGAGDVAETPGKTTVTVGDTVITIEDNSEDEDTIAPEGEGDSDDVGEAPEVPAGAPETEPEQSADGGTSLESFFDNLLNI